jgi:hypothetical protein
MSAIGQQLTLLTNANGAGFSPPTSAPTQWFGGRAKVYAWAAIAMSVTLEVSPDGGTTWIKVQFVQNDGILLGAAANLAASATFSAPALLVRAVGNSTSGTQNLNVVIVGYDDAA